jgi:hypothetical protein
MFQLHLNHGSNSGRPGFSPAVHQAAPQMQPVAIQPPPPQYVATVQAAQPQQHFMLQQSLMERNQKLYEVRMVSELE